MQIEDIQLLECVDCRGSLTPSFAGASSPVLTTGILHCKACDSVFPVVDGIGVFFRKEVFSRYLSDKEAELLKHFNLLDRIQGSNMQEPDKQLQVAKNWEYQWNEIAAYDKQTLERDPNDLYGETAFWKFVPIDPSFVQGKVVYVTCAGRGREAFHVAKQRPVRLIINEIGNEIYEIPRILPTEISPRTLLFRSDVCHSPLKAHTADLTICDHALQHVEDHRLGFKCLTEATSSNGKVCICVYSYENNLLMTHGIEPMKTCLHQLPLKMERFIAFFPALMLYLIIHGIYKPIVKIAPKAAEKLPLYSHMMFWSQSTLGAVWTSCFDLIHAPISYHFKKIELEKMAADNNLSIQTLTHTHGTMWSMVASRHEALAAH